jgi:hypothetical protein
VKAAAVALVAASLLAEGNAVFIADDLQAEVVQNRVKWRQVDLDPRAVGYVGLRDCGFLGQLVSIEWPDGRSGPLQVVDCAQSSHLDYLDRIEFAVEVSESEWRSQARVGERGGAWVRVWAMQEGARWK